MTVKQYFSLCLQSLVNRFYLLFYNNKVLRFIIAGSLGAITDLTILYILTDIWGVWYVFSTIVAFSMAFIVSFILQKFWTFKNYSKSAIRKQVPIYFVTALINVVVNTYLVFFLVHYQHVHYLLAQVITSCFIAVSSFVIYNKIIFLGPVRQI